VLSGEPVELKSPGARHDFVHAADVGAAITQVVQYDLRGVVDIGTGTLTSVGDLVTRLGARWQAAQGHPDAEHPNHAEPVADTSRLRATGWQPHRTEEFLTQ
jgi:nucleoside-diphosphate-sugar epimerase